MTTALKPLLTFRLESKTVSNYLKTPDELKVKLDWVYGIRSADTRRALQYTVGCLSADSVGAQDAYEKSIKNNNEELIFYVASVIILLNCNIKKQRHYLNHTQEVISIAVSTIDGSLIASGELGDRPEIHVWSRKTLETVRVIRGKHLQGVSLLQFTNDNRYLVSCSLARAVIVYDWSSGVVAVSTYLENPI
jgi:WD40 repeat protein